MASKRFTPEQIISKLREAEVLLPQGEKMTAELTTAPPGSGGFVAKPEEWDAVPSPFAPLCPSFITTLISMFSRVIRT